MPKQVNMKPHNLSPLAIKDRLVQNGYTLTDFSRKIGVSKANLCAVINRHCGRETRPSGKLTYKILLALSKELGFPVHRVVSKEAINNVISN
jgi:hypothetical protein